MPNTVYRVDQICDMNPTLYEEDSYDFLAVNQFADWYIYDSDQLGLPSVLSLANTFMAFHGKVSFPWFLKNSPSFKQYVEDGYWSSIPLGIFRYKMLSDGSPYLLSTVKNIPGYIVEGVYWLNGFVYLVRDEHEIIQLKLFMDKTTKEIQLYPDVHSL